MFNASTPRNAPPPGHSPLGSCALCLRPLLWFHRPSTPPRRGEVLQEVAECKVECFAVYWTSCTLLSRAGDLGVSLLCPLMQARPERDASGQAVLYIVQSLDAMALMPCPPSSGAIQIVVSFKPSLSADPHGHQRL